MKRIKDKKIILIALAVYLGTAVGSYFVFANTLLAGSSSEPPKTENGKLVFDDSLPKTEPCPLNGQKFSEQQREWWEGHRPLGVMIENHKSARPQSGFNSSDVVYEAVAEGGITRMLAIYYCHAPAQLGPIRSARTYFLDYISEYGDSPLYAHVGGANTPGPANALGQIEDYGWAGYNDLNQFSIGFPTFWRDYDRLGYPTATEHTMYSTTDKLWKFAAEDRGLSAESEDGVPWDEGFEPYSFKDEESKGSPGIVRIEHWSGYDDNYSIDWVYDPTTNTYKRENGGEKHIDNNSKEQVETKNIVVIKTSESRANDGYEGNVHLLYTTEGSGDALIYMDGKEIEGEWSKEERTGRTIITDEDGEEIEFNRGRIWFHLVPLNAVAELS